MPGNTPQRDSHTYRVLRTVQRFGDVGCTIAQFSSSFYTSRTERHNSMGSQALMSAAKRGLLLVLDPEAASKHRIYVLSTAGRGFLEAQLQAAAARARELAGPLEMPSPSAQAPSQEGDPSAVGTWEP